MCADNGAVKQLLTLAIVDAALWVGCSRGWQGSGTWLLRLCHLCQEEEPLPQCQGHPEGAPCWPAHSWWIFTYMADLAARSEANTQARESASQHGTPTVHEPAAQGICSSRCLLPGARDRRRTDCPIVPWPLCVKSSSFAWLFLPGCFALSPVVIDCFVLCCQARGACEMGLT